MKIGLFTPYLDTMSGGERYMLQIASILSEKSSVSIFWNPEVEVNIKKIAKEKLGINIDKTQFHTNIFSSKISSLTRFIESKKFDKILILSDGSLPIVSSELYVHYQFPVEWVSPNLVTKIKLRRVKSVFCNSIFTKKYIDKKFKITSSVVYPPVKMIGRSLKKENNIISVGRINRLGDNSLFKRQDYLINVFKKMVDKGLKNWGLTLVVSTKDEKDKDEVFSLKNLAQNYPITIISNPSTEDLNSEFASSKIYWHAAGFGQDLAKYPEKAEHFGITTVEAMSAGLVPVVYNGGGQKEIISNSEDGFLWDTEEELVKYTLSLINDEQHRSKISLNSVTRAKYFNEEKFRQNISEIILK